MYNLPDTQIYLHYRKTLFAQDQHEVGLRSGIRSF